MLSPKGNGMPIFIVLLRGVNVGKAKRVPMADFKALLLAQGCTRAETVLNSGNAVVAHPATPAPALARRLAAALATHFGFDVPVIVKTAREWQAVVAAPPPDLPEAEHPRLLVAWAQSPQAITALQPLARQVAPPEQLLLHGHAALLHCANGILASPTATALLGAGGKALTTRNWATVLKLQALAARLAT